MGRHNQQKRQRRRDKRAKASKDAGPETLEQLLASAEALMDEYDVEGASTYLSKALEIDADNPKALTLTANICLEAGDLERAKQCLGRAITVEPDSGHAKYMSMAQLMDGKDSLGLYAKGIHVLEAEMASQDLTEEKQKELRRELSSAHCAVAELFMTDLCDEAEAEEECKSSIEKAITTDTENPEALQTKARFLLIKEEFEAAKSTLLTSLSKWLPALQAVIENKQEASSSDPVDVCPLLYTTRISTAKLLIELELFDECVQVLEGLLEEDDSVVATWYLLGWVNRLRALGGDDGYNGNARFYLNKAKQVQAENPSDDDEMLQHIDEILEELGPETEEADCPDEPEGQWEGPESSDEEEEMDQA